MAVVASDRLTLATLASPTYVRTFYLKQASTLNPPGVPTANPPGGNWSTTEPTFSPNETATVYTVMLTAYGSNRNDYGPVQKSTSYEAAKQAYNQAIASGLSAQEATNKAQKAQDDLANLQIGGRNLIVVSTLDRSGYLRSDGSFTALAGWAVTGYIPVTPGAPYIHSGYSGLGTQPATVFYNANKQYMSGISGSTRSTFTVPSGAYFIRSSYMTTDLGSIKLERGTKASDWSPAPEDVEAGITGALDAVSDAKDWVQSRGTDLVTNGTGYLGDNTNFSRFTFDPTDSPEGASGSFYALTGAKFTDEIIPIDPVKKYRLMAKVRTRTAGAVGRAYTGLSPVDAQGLTIDPTNYVHDPASFAVLAEPVAPGDTTFVVDNIATGTVWTKTEQYKTVALWNWKDPNGRVWPRATYTRNTRSFDSVSGNVINLRTPYNGPAMPAGTPVSRNYPGGGYMYMGAINSIIPETWTPYASASTLTGTFDGGIGTTGGATYQFPPGTAGVRILVWNSSPVNTTEVGFSAISFSDTTEAQRSADDAKTKAENALADLATRPTKEYVNTQVSTSANGKSKITTSLNAPSGTGVNGDLWRRHDSSGHVYQEFTWRDGGWKPTMVTSQMVTNMDIHKLTVSGDATFTTLVADEIWSKIVRAKLIVATELIAGDAIVKNTLSADRLKAKTITAESGVIGDLAIKEAHIGNASVTNAKIKDINAGKITAGYINSARIDARTISTEKLLLGSFDNFFHDPRFEDPRGYSPGAVVGETLRLNASQTVNPSWLAIPVDKGESYTVRFRKTGTGNLTFAIHSATAPSGTYSLLGTSFNTATEEGDFEFTVTADKPYIKWVVSNLTAQSFISEIKIQKVFTGIRLEDGIITTEKIQAGAVVADSISADSITSVHMGANSVTATSIGADQIMGVHIGAETITGEHIMAESITAVNIEAEAITTDKLHAHSVTYDKIELGAVRGDNLGAITKDQFMNAIDADLSNIIDSAETIADSVIITPGEIRLTTEVRSSGTTTNETALSLTSTRQTFIVDGKDVVYIDSEEESMNIRNVVVDDSIQVGNHVIEKISDDITVFMWAGDR